MFLDMLCLTSDEEMPVLEEEVLLEAGITLPPPDVVSSCLKVNNGNI